MDQFLMYYQDSRHGKILLPTSHPVDCPCNSCMIGNMYMREEFIRMKIEEKKHRKPSLCQAMAREFEKYGYLHDEDYESDGEDGVCEEKNNDEDDLDTDKENHKDDSKDKGDTYERVTAAGPSILRETDDMGSESVVGDLAVREKDDAMASQDEVSLIVAPVEQPTFMPAVKMVDVDKSKSLSSKVFPAGGYLSSLPDLHLDPRILMNEIFRNSDSCMRAVDYFLKISSASSKPDIHPYAGLCISPRNLIPYEKYSSFLKRRILRVVRQPVSEEFSTKQPVMRLDKISTEPTVGNNNSFDLTRLQSSQGPKKHTTVAVDNEQLGTKQPVMRLDKSSTTPTVSTGNDFELKQQSTVPDTKTTTTVAIVKELLHMTELTDKPVTMIRSLDLERESTNICELPVTKINGENEVGDISRLNAIKMSKQVQDQTNVEIADSEGVKASTKQTTELIKIKKESTINSEDVNDGKRYHEPDETAVSQKDKFRELDGEGLIVSDDEDDDSVFGILGVYCRSEIHASYSSDADPDGQMDT